MIHSTACDWLFLKVCVLNIRGWTKVTVLGRAKDLFGCLAVI